MRWIDAALRTPLLRHLDAAGLAREDGWSPGGMESLPRPHVAHMQAKEATPSTPIARILDREWDPKDIMTRAQWTPDTMRDFKAALPVLQRFVASYVRMGGRVVAGTDTPQQFVVPGASLHRELQLYVAGGLTTAAALKAATTDAADLLGIYDRAGTVEVGNDEDLVLLDADPLADISATMRIRIVIRGGSIVYER